MYGGKKGYKFYLTSALTGEGIQDLFNDMARDVVTIRRAGFAEGNYDEFIGSRIRIDPVEPDTGKCCSF